MAKRATTYSFTMTQDTAKQSSHSHSRTQSDPHSNSDANSTIRIPFTTAAITLNPTLSIKFVSLHDWWLAKAEGKGLAVAGFETRRRLGLRVFLSGAIAKRHDAATLETVDGITIGISGFINKSRTYQNGFPFEVCSHFLFGFPYYWEDYATQSYGENSADKDVHTRKPGLVEFNMSSGSSANSLVPVSLDDLPVTRVRDLLMSPFGSFGNHAERNILDDVLGRLSNSASESSTPMSVSSNMKDESPITVVNSACLESPSNHKKAKVDSRCTSSEGILGARHTSMEEFQRSTTGNSKICVDILTPSTGVATRRMTRLKNHGSQQEENISLESSIKHKNSAQLLTPEGSGMVVTSALNGTNADIISRQGEDVMEIPDKSAVRRSSIRLKNQKKGINRAH